MWSVVMWSELMWFMWSDFVLKWFTVKFLGTQVPCTSGWPYTEGTWLYCAYFIWCVSCTVVVLTCFVMCKCVHVWVFWQMCGCFGNMCTCIYCVFYCLYCVLYCFVYVYLFLFVLSVLVEGLLPPSYNSVAISNNNNNTWATYQEITKLRNYRKQPY
jgi:hypothetical protein